MVAFAGWTLALLALLLCRRTYQVLFLGKKPNELGQSSVVAGDKSSTTVTPGSDEDTVWKRLERVHMNCVENCTSRRCFLFRPLPISIFFRTDDAGVSDHICRVVCCC